MVGVPVGSQSMDKKLEISRSLSSLGRKNKKKSGKMACMLVFEPRTPFAFARRKTTNGDFPNRKEEGVCTS